METCGYEKTEIKPCALPENGMSTNCTTLYKMSADVYPGYSDRRLFFP